nr:MAG TPA: hypothetical protein [Caudoviricetes sp.]
MISFTVYSIHPLSVKVKTFLIFYAYWVQTSSVRTVLLCVGAFLFCSQ